MESQLDQHQLWSALSDLFVDTNVDYKHIAGVAKNYSVEEIEFALFERVAPVCVSNMLAPVPPVCWYFDKEQLVADIESLVKKRGEQGRVGKCLSGVMGRLIRIVSAKVWAELKAEIERVKSEA
ncbi:hypothetical protein J2Y83_003089 [Pseudomonas marginalis]|uniref:DUF7079 family protein n=1 Tax=Pseudomonas TaxID=286 RepID=UPI0020A0B29A|nr:MULTISPECIES: hypothetical protein [Pseudomonas]MCP1507116.1 hypothetical protein [Pseudomonas marginalis]MCP1524620.1 hypothetical protein [Pseudomonas marginalis]MDQ0503093.1 hypothetical protein [Pseudomonas marginalis]